VTLPGCRRGHFPCTDQRRVAMLRGGTCRFPLLRQSDFANPGEVRCMALRSRHFNASHMQLTVGLARLFASLRQKSRFSDDWRRTGLARLGAQNVLWTQLLS
jgi:hypothetical protein